jgi:hypothetical protein
MFVGERNVSKKLRAGMITCHVQLQAGRSRVRDPMRGLSLLNLPNPFGRTKPWGLFNL